MLMAGLSPHYPWYYCWLLIPACIVPWSSALYLVTAAFLLYLNPTHMKLFWPAFLYGPFFSSGAAGCLGRKDHCIDTRTCNWLKETGHEQ